MVFHRRYLPESDDIFTEIKKIRLRRRVSIYALSDETKIPIKYLRALEEGNAKALPDVLYVKNIIKKYLDFFNIDPAPYLEKLRLARQEKESPSPAIHPSRFMVIPRFFKAALALSAVALLAGYVILGFMNIFSPPKITILSPQDRSTVLSGTTEVRGETEPGTFLTINNSQVLLDKNGGFSEEVSLQKGLNLIKISGVKRYSKERIIWLNVNLEIK